MTRAAREVLGRLKAILSPGHLAVLAAAVAQANFTGRFDNVFRVESP